MAMNRNQILGMLNIGRSEPSEELPRDAVTVKENIVVNGNILITKGTVIQIQKPSKK